MRGVWFVLKIHIVRKGDTLWEIAKQYGVDFEELKNSNPQLSSPDMIMPGMKIKIPTGSKTVKKETVVKKESKVPIVKETPKQAPVIKEDDHEKPKEVKIEMPKKHAPEMPTKLHTPKKEVPIPKEMHQSPIKEVPKVPMKEKVKMPVIEEEILMELPKTSQPKPPKKEEETIQQKPVAPIYHHYYHHCCPPLYHNCFPGMGEMHGGFMPYQQMQQGHVVPSMSLQPQQMMHPHDCGCHAAPPQMQQYQMREQLPTSLHGGNPDPFGYQSYSHSPERQIQSQSQGVSPFQSHFPNMLSDSVEKTFPMPPSFPIVSEFNSEDQDVKPEQETNN